MTDLSAEDVRNLRAQGDFRDFLRIITGQQLAAPPSAALAATEPTEAAYHIPRKGAWPCGTAASGPTPTPCHDCTEGTP